LTVAALSRRLRGRFGFKIRSIAARKTALRSLAPRLWRLRIMSGRSSATKAYQDDETAVLVIFAPFASYKVAPDERRCVDANQFFRAPALFAHTQT
jgi:hypothetical protein